MKLCCIFITPIFILMLSIKDDWKNLKNSLKYIKSNLLVVYKKKDIFLLFIQQIILGICRVMDIKKAFEIAFNRKKEKKWEKIYVLVDIHDTILKACYNDEETRQWFPYAKEALDIMSHAQQISLILWTSTYDDIIADYLKHFKENGITFDMVNVNHETKNTDLSCFDENTYFNVGIDDKFGFDAETDWEILYNYLVEGIRLGKFK